jgi:hypothetical protein
VRAKALTTGQSRGASGQEDAGGGIECLNWYPVRVMLISATLARRLDIQADAVKTVAGPDIRRNSITFIPRARMRAFLSGDICETLSPMYIPPPVAGGSDSARRLAPDSAAAARHHSLSVSSRFC